MKYFLLSLSLFAFNLAVAQMDDTLVADQNPNYRRSLAKYDSIASNYTSKQGTTVQDTYVAIDPMEHKRKMQELRREYRAQRPLWRQERRMARINNTQYVDYGFNNWNTGWNTGWNNGWNNGFGRNNRGWGGSRWNTGSFLGGTLLGIGLGCRW